MGVNALFLLLASWLLQGVVGAEFASQPLPITHRPGAILVKGPEVSAAMGAYRLFIGLPTYDYSPELAALSIHENASDSSLAALNSLHDNLSSPSSSPGSKLKQRLIALFHDLSKRIGQALTDLKLQQANLKDLQTVNLDASPISGHDHQSSQSKANKSKRDIADYFGLASTGEMAELNHWVTKLQNSEEKLAHSAERQISYLDRTVHRLNQQEDRINQLAAVELQWEKTIQLLEQSDATSPEYLELIITFIQGLAAVAYYEGNVRQQIDKDIQSLLALHAHQLPTNIISVSEFRHVLTKAQPIMPPGFAYAETMDELVTKLARLPVNLIRDPQNNRLYAQITVPVYDSSHSYRLVRVIPTPLENPQLPGIQEIYDLPTGLIAVSRNQFFSLETHDLFDCAQKLPVHNVMEHTRLCVDPPAILTYTKEGIMSSCAAALYFEPPSIMPKICQTRVRVAPVPRFTRLVRNIWVYSPMKPDIVRFVCSNSQIPSITLHPEGGRLVMPAGCSGICGEIQIPPFTSSDFHVSLPNETHLTFQSLNSSFWIHNVKLHPSDSTSTLLTKVKSALLNSTHLTMPLADFKNTLHGISAELDQNAVTHFLHHNSAAPHAGTVVTIILLAVVSIGTCCLGKCCWRRYRNSTRNQPSPQTLPMVTFAPPSQALITPMAPSGAGIVQDSPPPLAENPCRVVARRSRSRSRRVGRPRSPMALE